jgi:hypothetical protein
MSFFLLAPQQAITESNPFSSAEKMTSPADAGLFYVFPGDYGPPGDLNKHLPAPCLQSIR